MRPDESPNTPNDTPDRTPNSFDARAPQPQQPIPVSAPDQETNTTPTEARPFSDFADANPPAVTVAPFTAPKKSKKKPILIGLAAGLLALLGGGYAAYAMWWNAPNKVVDDALASVVMANSGTAKGTFDFSQDEGGTLKLTFDSKAGGDKTSTVLGLNTTTEGQSFKLGGTLVTDKSTYYIKAVDLKKTLTSLYGDSGIMSMFDPILAKIDNKWVVVTPDDVQRLTGEETVSDKEMTCVQNVLGGIKTNKTYQNELTSAYQNNRFILVKESKGVEAVEGRQSNHYVLSFDEAKGKSFGEALKKTTVFKAVDDCVAEDLAKSADEAEEEADSSDTPTVELWVDVWTHKPTRLKISSSSAESGTAVLDSTFNLDSKVTIDTPKADTTVKDIEAEITKLQEGFMPSAEFDTIPTEEL